MTIPARRRPRRSPSRCFSRRSRPRRSCAPAPAAAAASAGHGDRRGTPDGAGARAFSGRAGRTPIRRARRPAPVGRGPSELAVNPRTHTIYVTNGNNVDGPNAGGDTVSMIDARRCQAVDVSCCRGPWPMIGLNRHPGPAHRDSGRRRPTPYVATLARTLCRCSTAPLATRWSPSCKQVPAEPVARHHSSWPSTRSATRPSSPTAVAPACPCRHPPLHRDAPERLPTTAPRSWTSERLVQRRHGTNDPTPPT
jgi:hypothetical protein